MSKSREARDRENQSPDQQDYQSTEQLTHDEHTALGGQTNYGIGRESRTDFPRRSRANQGLSETSSRTPSRQQNDPYSTRYNQPRSFQQGSQRRGGYNYDRFADDRRSGYQNRQWTEEDSGDFYSRSIRERRRGEDYADPYQTRGYRSYEQENYPPANLPGFRWQNRDVSERTAAYRPQSYRDEQDYDRQRRTYDSELADARGYERDSWRQRGYQPDRRDWETNTADTWRESESHYGMEPWFDRGGQTYANLVRCRDLMTRDVTTCTAETSLRQVAEMMESENVGSIPVVENGRLLGLVTDRDIVCRIIAEGRDTHTTTAREAMTDDLITCLPEESVIDAIHKMGECQVRRILVCDPTGRLRGILSIGDVALEAERDMEVARALEQISEPNRYASHRVR